MVLPGPTGKRIVGALPIGLDRGAIAPRGIFMSEVKCVLKIRSVLGESPLWHPEEHQLYWLDLRKPAIYRFDPATGRNRRLKAALKGYVGAMVFRRKGGVLLLDQRGIFTHEPKTGALRLFAKPTKDMRKLWFNDAKCDRQGNLWAGVGDRKEKRPLGIFYRIGANGQARQIDDNFICPNGPAFSPDGSRCYFADSYANKIYRYDLDAKTGRVGPRRLFAVVPQTEGVPDGMTVDSDGGLWCCQWDGWRVTRYHPDGRIDRAIKLPVPRPTSVAFGGASLDTLYITSASLDMAARQLKEAPLSGSIFACRPGVRGVLEPRFAG
jgi:sugar lactone lactonase YvrE